MRFKRSNRDVLTEKTGIARPDAKQLLLDNLSMLPILMGAPISTAGALKGLGKSAVKIRSFNRKLSNPSITTHTARRKLLNWKLPTENVRKMAGAIRNTPKEVLEPLTEVKYKRFLNPRNLGANARSPGSRASNCPR